MWEQLSAFAYARALAPFQENQATLHLRPTSTNVPRRLKAR